MSNVLFGIFCLAVGLMDLWIEDAKVKPHNPDVVKALHVRFERIHPFIDGNGRIGRMLYNWQMVKQLSSAPRVFWEKEKREYYKWFDDEAL